MYPIYAFGSQEQKDRWIPALASGEAIGCFGLTEPDFGSNPGGMRTTARRVTATSGCSTAPSSGSPTAASPTSRSSGPRPRTASAASWSRGTPASPPPTARQVLAARVGDLGARLPGLPHPGRQHPAQDGRGLKNALMCLNQARYGIAWGGLGAAMECYHDGARVRQGAHPVRRPADRQPPAGAGQAGVDGQRDHQGAAAGPASSAGSRTRGDLKHYHVSLGKRNNVWVARECARWRATPSAPTASSTTIR